MQHQQFLPPTSSNALKQCLRGMLVGAMLATLAACGPGDETPPEPPTAAPSLVAHPVVIAAIPNTVVTSFAEVDYGALLPASTSTQSTTPILYGSIGGTLSSGQTVNIYDGETLLSDVANIYLGTSWSFKPSTPLSLGNHSFTAAVANADGTTGTRSAPFVITIEPPPIPTLVLGISPIAALAGTPTTFTVTGQKLPLTAELRIVTASCDTPTNRSETGFTAVCTPPAATNSSLAYLIYSNTQAAEGGPIGLMGTINVSTDPAAVAAEIAAAAAAATTPTPTPTPTAAVKLTDTGITSTQCYKAGSDTLVSCTSAEAIALNDKQDGMIGRDVTSPDNNDGKLGFSYSTVGNYDKTECVKDNITGLTWEGKPASGLRAITNTYTNYRDGRSGDASAYVTAVNATGLCGYTNWRLPTREELLSLVDYGSAGTGLAIDTTWLATQANSGYWTSSKAPLTASTPFAEGSAWAVFFADGRIHPLNPPNNAWSVRLVRQ